MKNKKMKYYRLQDCCRWCRYYPTILLLHLLVASHTAKATTSPVTDSRVSSTTQSIEHLLSTQSPSDSDIYSRNQSASTSSQTSIPYQHTSLSTTAVDGSQTPTNDGITTQTVSPTVSETGVNNGEGVSAHASSLNCIFPKGNSELPCQSDGCFMRHIRDKGDDGLPEPCLIGNHVVITSEGDYTSYYSIQNTSSPRHHKMPTNTWLLFKSREGDCQTILSTLTSSSLCILPGFCNSAFPWYLTLDNPLSITFGAEHEASLCVTDVTSRRTAACCQHPIRVTVRSCGFYSLYKLKGEMRKPAIGHICTANLSTVSDITDDPISQLSIKYTGEHGQIIPKHVNELGEQEANNLVTIRFNIYILSQFKTKETIAKFKTLLVKVLNEYLIKRKEKRALWQRNNVHPFTVDDIKTVIGSPKCEPGAKMLSHTIYVVQSDTGNILPRKILRRAALNVDNSELTEIYTSINHVTYDLPEDSLFYRQTIIPPPTTGKPRVENSEYKNSKDWMVIIYIIIFTCIVIVIAFLVFGIYRMKLTKALRSNRGRRLSKLEQWILCDRNASEENIMPMELKAKASATTNGKSNGTAILTQYIANDASHDQRNGYHNCSS